MFWTWYETDPYQDASLERCFGKKDKIIDCTWDYLETIRTLKAPAQPMPRLKDLLEYLTTPGLEHIWLILDIKVCGACCFRTNNLRITV